MRRLHDLPEVSPRTVGNAQTGRQSNAATMDTTAGHTVVQVQRVAHVLGFPSNWLARRP